MKDCWSKLNDAFSTLEAGLTTLFGYTDAKNNNPSNIDQAKQMFLKACSDGKCEKALKTVIRAINGADLAYDYFQCDLTERIYRGAPTMTT